MIFLANHFHLIMLNSSQGNTWMYAKGVPPKYTALFTPAVPPPRQLKIVISLGHEHSRIILPNNPYSSTFITMLPPDDTWNLSQVYRVIRVILESSLESEILRTLRTPSLSDNETLKALRLRVFGSLGLWHTSDSQSLRV